MGRDIHTFINRQRCFTEKSSGSTAEEIVQNSIEPGPQNGIRIMPGGNFIIIVNHLFSALGGFQNLNDTLDGFP